MKSALEYQQQADDNWRKKNCQKIAIFKLNAQLYKCCIVRSCEIVWLLMIMGNGFSFRCEILFVLLRTTGAGNTMRRFMDSNTLTPQSHHDRWCHPVSLKRKRTPWCVSATLTLSGPLVRLQHQVLFGLFQFFLQTLVLGSDFTDSLLAVLQQTKLGTCIHHLLTHTERERGQIWIRLTFIYSERCVAKHVSLMRQQPT